MTKTLLIMAAVVGALAMNESAIKPVGRLVNKAVAVLGGHTVGQTEISANTAHKTGSTVVGGCQKASGGPCDSQW